MLSHMTGHKRESKVEILGAESSVFYPTVTTVHLSSQSRPPGVNVSGLCASWSMERDKQVLTDISFQVDQVIIIIISICDIKPQCVCVGALYNAVL